jgi:hypothetical protein
MRISYRIFDDSPHGTSRPVDVDATEAELHTLAERGYVVRERLVSGELLEQLRTAADDLEREYLPKAEDINHPGFGGLYVRNLIDLHPAFEILLNFAPTLSVSRAMLGPQVQLHGSVLRVCYPNQKQQAAAWHFHQRVVPEPRPPFFVRPALVDHLLYLDDVTMESGPLLVMPRSHQRDEHLPMADFASKDGEVIVTCPAGTVVTAHTSLWHRALAPQPGSPKRRLIIWGHSPTWMKQVDKPSAGAGRGLSDRLVPGADQEMRELLGLAGYF